PPCDSRKHPKVTPRAAEPDEGFVRHRSGCSVYKFLYILRDWRRREPALAKKAAGTASSASPAASRMSPEKGRFARIGVDVSGDDERQRLPSCQQIGPEVARRQLVEKRTNLPFDSRRLHHSTRSLRSLARGRPRMLPAPASSYFPPVECVPSERMNQRESRGTNLENLYNQCVFFVYMVRCADGTLYTGLARDPYARVKVHNS